MNDAHLHCDTVAWVVRGFRNPSKKRAMSLIRTFWNSYESLGNPILPIPPLPKKTQGVDNKRPLQSRGQDGVGRGLALGFGVRGQGCQAKRVTRIATASPAIFLVE